METRHMTLMVISAVTIYVVGVGYVINHGSEITLVELKTDRPSYLEHQQCTITASFRFPRAKHLSDYSFLWTVTVPFIAETTYVYEHDNPEGSKERFQIKYSSESSGSGVITVTVADLKLEDQREIRLTVYNRERTREILQGTVSIRVVEVATPVSQSVQANSSITTWHLKELGQAILSMDGAPPHVTENQPSTASTPDQTQHRPPTATTQTLESWIHTVKILTRVTIVFIILLLMVLVVVLRQCLIHTKSFVVAVLPASSSHCQSDAVEYSKVDEWDHGIAAEPCLDSIKTFKLDKNAPCFD